MALVEIDFHPDVRTLRSFGFVALFGFGLLAAAAWTESLIFAFGLGSLRAGVTVGFLGLGLLSAGLSLVAPRANRPIWIGLSMVAFPIGFVISWLVFTLLYFGLITPLALLFRLIRRDELRLRPQSAATSYWVESAPEREPERYFKQF